MAVKSGVRDARLAHQVLGERLVGAAHACRRARAGVRHADRLQQPLHGAVLAVARRAAPRTRRRARARAAAATRSWSGVDRDHLVAEPAQRVLDLRARAQRDRALQRAPTLEHRDPRAALIDPVAGGLAGRVLGVAARQRDDVGERAEIIGRRVVLLRGGRLSGGRGRRAAGGDPGQACPAGRCRRPWPCRSGGCPRGCPRLATPAKFRRIEEPPLRPSM